VREHIVPRVTGLALLCIFIGALTACERAPSSPLAPTALDIASNAAQFHLDPLDTWGAAATNRTMAASQSSGFFCALGPFGVAEQSHHVVSASGNESLVCSGMATAPAPEQALILKDFPCMLPSGRVTTDSHFVFTPSGHATLNCQSK